MVLLNSKQGALNRGSQDLEQKVTKRLEQAKGHEDVGDYEAARDLLKDVWGGVGEAPQLDGLSPATAGELLLRAGTLSGWIGSNHQIEGAQEMAKDLITRAVTIFEELGATEKAAEARIDLSTCYWREGAYPEARISLHEACGKLKGLESKQELRATVNLAMVELFANRLHDAKQILENAQELIERHWQSSLTLGLLQSTWGLTLKRLGDAERNEEYSILALKKYSAAIQLFEVVGHKRFVARVSNNLGSLLYSLGRFIEAQHHLERAHYVFAVELKDPGSVAQVNETRAKVCIALKKYADAERLAYGAAHIFERGGEMAQLAEALTTQGIALTRLNQKAAARRAIERAIEVAEMVGDLEAAGLASLVILEELENEIPLRARVDLFLKADELLESSQNAETLYRLRKAGRGLFRKIKDAHPPTIEDLLTGGTFEDEVLRYEAELIRIALGEAKGQVTQAAQLLGVTHQRLSSMLKGRHKNLLSERTPLRKKREKSIIKK